MRLIYIGIFVSLCASFGLRAAEVETKIQRYKNVPFIEAIFTSSTLSNLNEAKDTCEKWLEKERQKLVMLDTAILTSICKQRNSPGSGSPASPVRTEFIGTIQFIK